MAPGRIDLGMGRATAGPVIDVAMQTNRQHPSQADHGQQILETMAWLYEKFPEDHPFHGKPLMPGLGSVPQTWVLGSSPASAQLAGALGLGYCFAGFIDPSSAVTALEIYRSSFQPGRFALPEPRSILAVNVAVGEDDQDGEHLALSPKGFYARLARAGKEAGTVLVPTPPRIEHELTEAQREEPTRIVDGRWPRFVAGGPDTVRATLEQMATESGAGEIMVQDLIPDPGDRRRSHALLAETWGLLGEDTTP
jgi:luciferase family oxidoreductase group 1